MNGWDIDPRDPDELAAARRWIDEAYAPRDDRAALLGLALAGLLLTPLFWLCGLLCRVADWGLGR